MDLSVATLILLINLSIIKLKKKKKCSIRETQMQKHSRTVNFADTKNTKLNTKILLNVKFCHLLLFAFSLG